MCYSSIHVTGGKGFLQKPPIVWLGNDNIRVLIVKVVQSTKPPNLEEEEEKKTYG
jgi:hypothetical protein